MRLPQLNRRMTSLSQFGERSLLAALRPMGPARRSWSRKGRYPTQMRPSVNHRANGSFERITSIHMVTMVSGSSCALGKRPATAYDFSHRLSRVPALDCERSLYWSAT